MLLFKERLVIKRKDFLTKKKVCLHKPKNE